MASIPRASPSTIYHRSSPTCHLLKTRSFSSTASRAALKSPRFDVASIAPKQNKMSTRLKQIKTSDLPDDIGIMPGTIVRPPLLSEPSLLSKKFRQRLLIEYTCIRQTISDFIQKVIAYRWPKPEPGSGLRKKLPLVMRERHSIARDLHRNLYTAIANNERDTIRQIACSGLAQQQISRLDRRRLSGDDQTQVWRLKYRGWIPPKGLLWPLQWLPGKAISIVSDRHGNLPFGDNMAMRQVILRIKSKQSLTEPSDHNPKMQDMEEYLVLQRITMNDKPGNWKVWGTTKASTYEDALEIRDLQRMGSERTSFMDSVRDKMSGMGNVP